VTKNDQIDLADVGDSLAEDVFRHVEGILLFVVDGFDASAVNLELIGSIYLGRNFSKYFTLNL
jgi:hypothetical protein